MQEDLKNVVLIGRKNTMDYVMAVVTQAQEQNEIIIKARGRAISKAVDVAQVAVNKFVKNFKIGEIKTGTVERELSGTEGVEPRKINVSTIEIQLIRQG